MYKCAPVVVELPTNTSVGSQPFNRNRPVVRPSAPNDPPEAPKNKGELQRLHGPEAPLSGVEQYDIVLLCPHPNPGSKSKSNLRRKAIAARCRFVGLEVAIDTSDPCDTYVF